MESRDLLERLVGCRTNCYPLRIPLPRGRAMPLRTLREQMGQPTALPPWQAPSGVAAYSSCMAPHTTAPGHLHG